MPSEEPMKRLLELSQVNGYPQKHLHEGWELARPIDPPLWGDIRNRLRAAWEVLRGRACAVIWHQGRRNGA